MIWWWRLTCKEACTPESITDLGSDVKNKSMQENDVLVLIWCKSFCEANVSVFVPSKLVLSSMHQLHDLALKSPNRTTKNEL